MYGFCVFKSTKTLFAVCNLYIKNRNNYLIYINGDVRRGVGMFSVENFLYLDRFLNFIKIIKEKNKFSKIVYF